MVLLHASVLGRVLFFIFFQKPKKKKKKKRKKIFYEILQRFFK